MYGRIDTGKAAKCQGSLVLYWFSAQLSYKSVRDILSGISKKALTAVVKKKCVKVRKSLGDVVRC